MNTTWRRSFPLPDGSPSSKQSPPARLFRWNVRPSPARPTPSRRSSSTTAPANSRASTSASACRLPPRLDRLGPTSRSRRPANPAPGTGLTHYDLKTGKSTSWTSGPDDRSASRSSCRARTSAEGDGWLLSVLYARRGEDQHLACSRRPTSRGRSPGLICRAASPAGFHGNWRAGTLSDDHRPSPQQLALRRHPVDAARSLASPYEVKR